MKQLKIFMLTALLAMAGNAYGDELKVANFTINPGATYELSVELDNPDREYIMTEFWMSLPEGISIAKDEDDEFMYEEGSRFDKTHTLTISEESGNVYHFLIYSSKNKALKGNSGELFSVTLEAAEGATTGTFQGKIYSQIFSDPDKVEYNPADVTFSVTIEKLKEWFSVEIASGEGEYGTVSVSPEVTGSVEEGTELTVTATPKEGYHFSQWSDGTTENPYQLTVGGAIQLSAEFAPNQYTVTFVFDNGDGEQVFTQDYKSEITKPADPTKEGFTFKGWDPEVAATVPAADVTYTAQWERNSYKLTYVVDGATVKEESVLFEAAITPEAEPTKEGYTFSGWSEIPETMPAKDVTVTGTFTVNKYKLTYQVDGAEYKTSEVDFGTNITPEAEPTKEGYTFSGWSEIPETMPAKDVTVTGTFTVNKYKLTYTIDGEVYKTVEVEYGATITPEPTPSGDYDTFEWVGVPETMPAQDVTVTATYTTGINVVSLTLSKPADVYTLSGKKVRSNVTTLKDLPRGIYVIQGRKFYVK